MMFKLVVLIEPQDDLLKFETEWPRFLALAEKMPGLVKEAKSSVRSRLYGNLEVSMIFEMFFESFDALKAAMVSPEGVAAGQMLQTITDGKVTLLYSDHMEDDLKNIQAYKKDKKGGEKDDKR
jgi:uncharacterized protein (TIGR02118 family)